MDGLNMGIILELPVILPPLGVQQQIVQDFEMLQEECDGMRALYTRKLVALAELKASLLHQAFSGEL